MTDLPIRWEDGGFLKIRGILIMGDDFEIGGGTMIKGSTAKNVYVKSKSIGN